MKLDKEAFFASVGYKPHPGQLAVHRSKAKRRIWIAGVRTGKSLAAAYEAVAAAMEPRKRSMGWCVAPTLDLCDKVYREIVIIVAEHLKHRLIELKQHEKKIVVRNLGGGVSEIRGKTADNPVSLLGEGLSWVIIDEAARMKPAIWHSFLSQRLIDKDGWALAITTPRGRGWVWDLWKRGQPGGDPHYESWCMPSWTNPHLDRQLIEAERGRLPEAVFRQEYGAEWIEGCGQVLRNVRELARGKWRAPNPKRTYVAGLDLARTQDYTVLVIMSDRRRVVFMDRFTRLDWAIQVQRLKAALERYDDPPTLVDSTGLGEPVYEALVAEGINAKPYQLSHASKNALVNNLVLAFERRDIVLPAAELCPELIDELESFQYTVTDQGNVRTGAASGCKDDCVVALALAVWELDHQGIAIDEEQRAW